ncbi:branched-chain amino acid ABC transporter permease [Salinibaculum salinum]|uniref:branched-chain amino acid ABC transporter permease n=1 Tax=Salinibaculum salinum TaxID=3131996 RepID=UPI0030EB8237
MSNLFTRAIDRYDQFRRQWYALPVLLAVTFVILAALPVLRRVAVLGYAPLGWLSLNMLIITLIWATTAQAWNIMSGYTGQFSFGHAAFFGLGAYTTIILTSDFGISPWVGMLIGSVLAAVYGLLIGALTFRYELKGHYFALATLAFAELLRYTFNNVATLGGASGYFRPLAREYADGPGLAAFQFVTDLPYYYVILGFLVIVTAVSLVINRSQLGYYLFAIREREQAASAIGVPTYRYKLLGISVSAFFTAWPGAFWAMYFNTIRPDTVFELLVNVEVLLPAIVGGVGTVLGPIVGAFIVTPVSEFVRQSFDISGLNNAVYGIVLIAIVLYSPKGVVSWPSRLGDLLRKHTGLLDSDDS